MSNQGEETVEIQEGDGVVLRATVARANKDQAFIEFKSMEGPFSVRVPLSELLRVNAATIEAGDPDVT